jgi:hypothetical protein
MPFPPSPYPFLLRPSLLLLPLHLFPLLILPSYLSSSSFPSSSQVMGDLEASKYQLAEWRVSIYGKPRPNNPISLVLSHTNRLPSSPTRSPTAHNIYISLTLTHFALCHTRTVLTFTFSCFNSSSLPPSLPTYLPPSHPYPRSKGI